MLKGRWIQEWLNMECFRDTHSLVPNKISETPEMASFRRSIVAMQWVHPYKKGPGTLAIR